MRRTIVAIIVVLLGGARLAGALGPVCCACIPDQEAHTSGTNQTAIGALFCAAAPPADLGTLAPRCAESPGYALECIPAIPGTSCTAELADAGVTCPSSGVPTTTPTTLLALTVILAALGAMAARRRRGAPLR